MSAISLTLLLSLFVVAYMQRDAAASYLWRYLVTNDILSWQQIIFENFILWFLLYIPAQLILYVLPTKKIFLPFKFNAAYPPRSLMVKEFLRSLRGVFICSLIESSMYFLLSRNLLPRLVLADLDVDPGTISIFRFTICVIPLLLWGDAHFYFTHRLLHSAFFYRTVHKFHHESFNPTPFSGLSMHPIESFIYFTSAPTLLPFIPIFLFRLMIKSTIIAPLEGHAGFGNAQVESSVNHYIHHSKFDFNYGASPLWDYICGTNYTKHSCGSQRYGSAKEQAKYVGIELKEE